MIHSLLVLLAGMAISLGILRLAIVMKEKHEIKKKKRTEAEKEAKLQEMIKKMKATGLSPSSWSGYITLRVKNMLDLAETRHALREALGKWNDKKGTPWVSGDTAYCEWKSEVDGFKIEITLRCNVEDFPQELQSENCKIVKEVKESYSYVCSA